jgi:hypothetical protein
VFSFKVILQLNTGPWIGILMSVSAYMI